VRTVEVLERGVLAASSGRVAPCRMAWWRRAAGLKIAGTVMPSRKTRPMLFSKPLLVSVIVTSVAQLLVAASPAAASAADTTPPMLAVPADVHYQQKQAGSIVRMTYRVGVHDDVDPHPRTSCLPRSGSRFAIGTTKVTCTAEDSAGNTVSKSFRIVVSAKSGKHAKHRTIAPAKRVIPAARRTPRLTARAYRRTAQGTQLLGVKVQRVTKGAVVTVSCNRRCPPALKTPVARTSRGSSVSLAALFERSRLQAGTTVTVTTAGPGVRAKSSRIVIRAHKAPVIL
jgi:hypothetical protein